jgi:TP901 family phage tail tape measure protein
VGFGTRPEARGKLSLDGADWDRTLKQANQQFSGFTSAVDRMAKRAALAIAGLAIGASFVGANFEDAMKGVEAVAGATAPQLERLEKAARDMGAATAFSASQAAGAQEELLKAGLAVNDTIKSLEGTLKFAGAAGAELAFSAELGAATMKTWRLEADQANRIFNALLSSMNVSRLGAESLNAAIGAGGAVLATWGVELEESLAVLAALTDVLGDGSTAGTFAKNVLSELTAVVREQKGVLGEVLATWDPATDGIIGAVERLERAGVSGRTALEELGQRGGPGLAILLERGSESLRQLEQQVTGTNAAFAAYETRMDSTKGRWQVLRSALEEGAIRTFERLQGQIDRLLELITTAVQSNFDSISTAAAQLGVAIETTIDLFIDLHGWIEDNSTVVGLLTSAFVGLTAAIYATRTAMLALTAIRAATSFGPLVAAIGAVAGVVAFVIDKLYGWQRIWTQVVGEFRTGLVHIQAIGGAFEAIQKSLANPRAAGQIWREFRLEHAQAVAEIEATTLASLDRIRSARDPGNAPIGAGGFDASIQGAIDALGLKRETAEAEVEVEAERIDRRADLLLAEADFERELAVRGHVETLELMDAEHLSRQAHFERETGIYQEFADRTRHISQAMWGAIVEQTATATSIQGVMKLKLGQIIKRVAFEGAAAEIEAQGQVAAKRAVIEAAFALAALARLDFRGAALHGAASAKFFAAAGLAAIGAASLRHVPESGGGGAEIETSGGAGAGDRGSGGGGRSTVDITQRSAPETVNIYVQTTVQGNILGDFAQVVDDYVVPRLRKLVEQEAF